MADYSQVPTIVDALLAEGLHTSAGRVRERLGSGSYEVIQRHINARLRALGRLAHADEANDSVQTAPDAAYTSPADVAEPPRPLRDGEGEAALLAALAHLPAVMAAVQDLQVGLEQGARWLYTQRLAAIDWTGMTEVQRMLNTPENYGGLLGQMRVQGTAFLTAAERLHRALQRDYAGLQATQGGVDDDRPAA
jgi:hypothetical protein